MWSEPSLCGIFSKCSQKFAHRHKMSSPEEKSELKDRKHLGTGCIHKVLFRLSEKLYREYNLKLLYLICSQLYGTLVQFSMLMLYIKVRDNPEKARKTALSQVPINVFGYNMSDSGMSTQDLKYVRGDGLEEVFQITLSKYICN